MGTVAHVLAGVCHRGLMRAFWRTFIIDYIIRCLMIRLMSLVIFLGGLLQTDA